MYRTLSASTFFKGHLDNYSDVKRFYRTSTVFAYRELIIIEVINGISTVLVMVLKLVLRGWPCLGLYIKVIYQPKDVPFEKQ